MATRKPLPNVPGQPTVLSRHALQQRTRFIRFVLSELTTTSSWIQSEIDQLSQVIQNALDSLPTGEWLANRRKHRSLCLCLAPIGSRIQLADEEDFYIIPTTIRCSFRSDIFFRDDAKPESVLYGPPTPDSSNDNLVGGTFQFFGIPSSTEHNLLYTALKLALYVHLSLVLEQHVLADSGVKLVFLPANEVVRVEHAQRHKFTKSMGSSAGSQSSVSRDLKEDRDRDKERKKSPLNIDHININRNSLLPNGLRSFLAKRSLGSGNTTPTSTVSARAGSLDISRTTSPDSVNGVAFPRGSQDDDTGSHHSRPSLDDLGNRLRRFSFASSFSGLSNWTGHGRDGSTSTSHTASTAITHDITTSKSTQFTSLLSKIQLQISQNAFSTSLGVHYPLPLVLVRLSERERQREAERQRDLERRPSVNSDHSSARKPQPQPLQHSHHHQQILMGDDRTALTSLLGWVSSSGTGASGGGSGSSGSVFSSNSGASNSTAITATGSPPSKGLGMIGIPGFIRHQEISVLESSHIPLFSPMEKEKSKSNVGIPTAEKGKTQELPKVPAKADLGGPSGMHEQVASSSSDASQASSASSSDASLASSTSSLESDTSSISSVSTVKDGDTPKANSKRNSKETEKNKYNTCAQPYWKTYRFFDFPESSRSTGEDKPKEKDSGSDRYLGEMIEELVDSAERICWEVREEQERERERAKEKEKEGSVSDGHGERSGSVNGNEEGGGSKEKEKDREKRDKDKGKARCEAKVGRHERRYIHGDVRIGVTVRGANKQVSEELEEKARKEDKGSQRVIQVWESCSICGAETEKSEMSDGAYLFSFAKYLELLIYSPVLARISTSLCEHTNAPGALPSPTSSSPSSPTTPTSFRPSQITKLPEERFNIVRHFATVSQGFGEKGTGKDKEFIVSFSLSPVKEVFELRVPRLKVYKDKDHTVASSTPLNSSFRNSIASEVSAWSATSSTSVLFGIGEDENNDAAEKKKLRKEIKVWWEGVADHLDALEEKTFEGDADALRALKKALPRLPSVDDAYSDFDDDISEPERESTALDTPTPLAEPPASFATPKPETQPEARRKGKMNIGDYFNFQHHQALRPPRNTPATPLADPLPVPVQQRPALLGAFRSTASITDFVRSQTSLKAPSTPNVHSSSTPDLSSSSESAQKPLTSIGASTPPLTSTSSSSSSSADPDITPTTRYPQTASLKAQPDKSPSELLMNLRQTFQKTEQSLYMQLAKTPASSLNDVRRAFLSSAKGAQRRLGAWQEKHLGGKKGSVVQTKTAEPEWWDKACHVLPEGNIVIREDDWGSIIAFALSSADYCRELANMTPNRHNGGGLLSPQSQEPPPALLSPSTPEAGTLITSPSSFLSAATATGYKLFRSSAVNQPDPDQSEDVIWHEPESYSAVISRKDHPRDPTSLLSIREVLRQKTPATTDLNILSSSRFNSLRGLKNSGLFGSNGGKNTGISTPPSAWSKPEVQVIKQDVGGEVISGLPSGSTERLVHELEPLVGSGDSIPVHSRPSSVAGTYSSSANEGPDSRIMTSSKSQKEGSFSSLDSESDGKSDSTIGRNSSAEDGVKYAVPPALPPKDQELDISQSASSTRSHFSTLTSGLSNAMRYVSNYNPMGDLISRPTSAASNHHGLLSTELPPHILENEIAIMERPHIKYDWTIGKRLKFSCTVYYAKQFDNLRRKCGVEDIFLKSLSRSTNWSADGGKSRSNFWKTKDDRFIIKTLVNAWNVADLQVLLDLGPSYFRYIDSTATKATVLAKLLGFYTVEIRNLETGAVQSKADLLVMENLFYDQKVDKTFDLKGIQGRKVKGAAGQTSKTLFDGEWIEGQQQSLTLVCPHSKIILREAIKSDADFLSKSNIMDYSLLLGVDTEHKQIACGLVDTIGSYTFAKTLEYKAKQGLQSAGGKEVTVVPPAEYQERFVNALERYFLACPDKWSRPLDDVVVVGDPDILPSVL